MKHTRPHVRTPLTSLILLSLLATAVPTAAVAAEPRTPVASYSFDGGTAASDTAGVPALGLEGGAVIAAQSDRGGDMALSLGSGASSASIPDVVYDAARTSGAFTVEFDARSALNTGNFFTYALGLDDSRYLFLRLRGTEAYAAVTSSSWSGETKLSASVDTSGWHHYELSFSDGYLVLAIDGELAAVSAQSSVRVADLLTSGFSSSFGKSFYANDRTFQGSVDNVTIFADRIDAAQRALSEVPGSLTFDSGSAQLESNSGLITWTSQTTGVTIGDDGHSASIVRPAYAQPPVTGTLTASASAAGSTATKTVTVTVTPEPSPDAKASADLDAVTIPGLSEVRSDLTLPTVGTVYGSTISWTSSDPSIISTDASGSIAAGVVHRPTDADRVVTLTATAGTVVRTYRVRVLQAVPPITTTDYVFAHFTNNEESHSDEQMYFATSSDGLTWKDTRPAGQPLLASDIGDRGVRDPYLVRSPQGDTFYLIATDLNIHDRGGWGSGAAYANLSPNLVVWESHDLATWSAPRLVDVVSRIDGGMAWAPEALWDEKAGLYYVYWSTSPKDDSGRLTGSSRIYISTTRDFVTFTDPQPWIERPNDSVIDTTMFHVGDMYYRASADAQITIEKSDSVLGQWSTVGTLKGILQDDKYDRRNFEGPEFFAYNADDIPQAKGKPMPYGLMADHPNGGDASVPEGYVPFFTSDPGSSAIGDWAQAPNVDFGSLKKRHGTILPVTASERAALENAASAAGTGSLPLVQAADVQSVKQKNDDAGALDRAAYTAGSWERLESARAGAYAVLADPGATQNAADAAAAALDAARAALVTVPSEPAIAQYDFSDGKGTDVTGHGHDLTFSGAAAVEAQSDRGGNPALVLHGGGDHARIPDAVFAAAGDDVTIDFSAQSRTATGNFFSLAVGQDDQRYFLFSAWEDHVRSVISKDSWRAEQGVPHIAVDAAGWHDYRIVLQPGSLALYQDGILIGYDTNVTTKLSDLGGTIAYIGRSFYAGDASWVGAIDDLTIYAAASAPVIPTGLSITGQGVSSGALTIEQGSKPLLSTEPAPDGATHTRVTWSSSDTSVVTVDAAGVVTALREGQATITATSTIGSASATLAVTVEPAGGEQLRANMRADLDAVRASVSTETTENLPLVTTGPLHGSAITWTSSDQDRVTGTDTSYQAPAVGSADPFAGGGVITRNAYGAGDATVSLTPTARSGGLVETAEPLQVTVKERPRSAPNVGYASANFATFDGRDQEQIWISSTEKNDFFSFKTRNGGNPAISNDADTYGLRDPYLFRSHDGDKYYIIATDLNTSGGDWGQYTTHGSLKIEAWESTDLVHWTRTNGDGNGGVTVNSDLAGMTWAPEAYWDDELQSYVVFFASRMYEDAAHTRLVPGANGNGYEQVLAVITRDFKTFTAPPIAWQNTGYYRIDTSVFKIGDYYYRLTKNGEPGAEITAGHSNILEKSKVLTSLTTAPSENTDPATGWQKIDQDLLLFEGPASVKLNPGDPNQNAAGDAMILLSDLNVEGGYIPFMTSQSQVAASSWNNRLSQTPGWFTTKAPGPGVTGRVSLDGMPDVRRHGAFVNVPQTVLDATKSWSSITAVSSTVQAEYASDTRKISAKVTASDGGEVAGTVTFAAGDWTSTVALSAGAASVTVPSTVTGTVSVSYDGYRDGLVSTSAASVDVGTGSVPSPSPTATPGPTAAPTETPAPGGSPVALVSTSVAEQGSTVRVSITGLQPGEQVSADLRSQPIIVTGIPAADSSGAVSFDVKIPRDLPVGAHAIHVRDGDGVEFAVLPLTVIPPGQLAVTGAQAPLGVALIATALLLAGGYLLMLRPRRRRSLV